MKFHYPILEQFFGGYYHQDWVQDHSFPDNVVYFYRGDVDDETRCKFVEEISSLLSRNLSESALEHFIFNEKGCSYDYKKEWNFSREWLIHLRDIVSAG